MIFNRRNRLALLISISLIIALGCYFFSHFPIGTFTYNIQNNSEPKIKIKCSEDLSAFQEPVYHMVISIEHDQKTYRKKYSTSDNIIYFGLLRKNNQEFIIIHDTWKGYSKCKNGKCDGFFNLEDVSFSIDHFTNDTTYIQNYSDSLKADTLSYIEFRDFKFSKIK